MCRQILIQSIHLLLYLISLQAPARQNTTEIFLNFYGDTLVLPVSADSSITLNKDFTEQNALDFYARLKYNSYAPLSQRLLDYKREKQLDDWLFYQLIRTTAEAISAKALNYQQYTLYKWFLLVETGYDATISIYEKKILLYTQCNDEILEEPYHYRNGKKYVCLNYHDYGEIDFTKEKFKEVPFNVPDNLHSFTYKITRLPYFKPENYAVKNLQFDYDEKEYHFKILVNEQVKAIFANYPVVDYAYYFNIPVSNQTYSSLIPALKQNIKKMNQKHGVDYLMRFTRYAFAYETDTRIFGKEKRLSPEQTLLYEYSDCEDRSAFFFYLVKEIYNLPMIVLSYPDHITIAVKFDKRVGKPILYKGVNYSICEATPQRDDLSIGQSVHKLRKKQFDVVYQYNPPK